jgi:hypothetical protein
MESVIRQSESKAKLSLLALSFRRNLFTHWRELPVLKKIPSE